MKLRLYPLFASAIVRPLLAAVVLSLSAAQVQADRGDERVLSARDAFRAGDRAKLANELSAVHGHELEPYVEYWVLRNRLDEASPAEVAAFLARNKNSLVAERLRLDWIKQAGKRSDWATVSQEFPALQQPDPEATCYALSAHLNDMDVAALDQGLLLWQTETDLPANCKPIIDALTGNERLRAHDVWLRIRRLLEAKKPGAARQMAAYLPADQRPDGAALDAVIESPLRFLDRQAPNFAISRSGRELAMAAIQRLARANTQAAADRWESLRDRFNTEERSYIYGQLGWQGALHHLPQAVAWYKAAEDTPLSDDQAAWKVRAALRVGNWKLVRSTIEDMPEALASKPEWTYWLGRALAQQGKRDEGLALFAKIAGQANFYGNLADDELGRLTTVPPKAARLSSDELEAAAQNPAIRRALALYRLDLRTEGLKEFAWALRNGDDRFLLAAAELAKRASLYDRAISAADRTKSEHDFELRYLSPFREHVEPAARSQGLDPGWVYGLMRQESRFVMSAKSGVGASGLMQVMPSTAAYVAKKLGWKNFNPSKMQDLETNVALGTNYLRMVMAGLGNQPVLASAAYNAGPGRARNWQDARPLEAAIYIETIPFTETRDYVKKVMSNAVYYAALFESRPQSLKSRLGTISGRSGAEPLPEDLP